MRVLLINYELPPIGGGAGNATGHIARCLAAEGAEVRVVTSRFDGLPHRERRDGYEIVRTPAIRRNVDRCTPAEMLTFVVGAAPTVLTMGARWNPGVACAFFGVPTGPLALMLEQRYGTPYTVSLRGGDVPGFMGQELATLHRLTRPLVLATWQHADSLIANSPGLVALARQTSPDARIELIPNGIDVETFQPPQRVRPASPLRLLYVGRLANQKGVLYLLQALALSRSTACLRIVGDGPERARLERIARELHIEQRVEFSGWASRADLPCHYAWADVFVLPSLDEGMPNVVLEAQASGLPVIGTDVAGTRDLVTHGQTGYLVPTADPRALADAIERLWRDERLVRTLGSTSRSFALGHRWETVGHQYWRVLASASRVVPGMPQQRIGPQ